MKKLLRRLFYKPVLQLSNRYSSKPEKQRIYTALSDLLSRILNEEKEKGLIVPFDVDNSKIIIFSDQHKGARNGADDFLKAEQNYLAALDFYYAEGYHFISLGDSEELWENTLHQVKKHQKPAFEKEARFIPKNAFIKIFGNHDLFWDNDPFSFLPLHEIYNADIKVYEGVVLQTSINQSMLNIFCTHGHQGDKVSDGNWFSKFFIARIWAPFQSYLDINPNTPAYDAHLKTLHNALMYEWCAEQKNVVLITGHTHQPVFESLTHIERLYKQLLFARMNNHVTEVQKLEEEIKFRKFEYQQVSEEYLNAHPGYFNTGCCCFDDGDITGIEIADSCIRLIEWKTKDEQPYRLILEEKKLDDLLAELNECKL